MGQFRGYIDSTFTPPRLVTRILLAVVAAGHMVGAVTEPTLVNIVRAVLLAALAAMSAAPQRVPKHVDDWSRAHPVAGGFLTFAILAGCGFAGLTYVLDPELSAWISFSAAAVLVTVTALRDTRRGSPPDSDGEPLP